MKILVEVAIPYRRGGYDVKDLYVEEFPFVSVLNAEHIVFIDNIMNTVMSKFAVNGGECDIGWVFEWNELQLLLDTLDQICVEYETIPIEDDEENPLDWRSLCKSKGFDFAERWDDNDSVH